MDKDTRFKRTPKNGCGACHKDFSSVEAFDRHRVGKYDPDERRCLTTEELEEMGWEQDKFDRWFDPIRSDRAKTAFH